MNSLLVLVPLVLIALPARVEAGQLRHLESAAGHHVFVIDADHREWQGRLVDVTKDSLTIEGESGAREFPLHAIRRVDADGDRVRDGAVKGAVVGLLLGLLASGATGETNARFMVASVATYSLIGVSLDALNRCKQTVYRAPAAQAGVTIRW